MLRHRELGVDGPVRGGPLQPTVGLGDQARIVIRRGQDLAGDRQLSRGIAAARVRVPGTDPLEVAREGVREVPVVSRCAPVRSGRGERSRLPAPRRFIRMVEQDAVVGVGSANARMAP
jgi:hypothetical protein